MVIENLEGQGRKKAIRFCQAAIFFVKNPGHPGFLNYIFINLCKISSYKRVVLRVKINTKPNDKIIAKKVY
jgi:hypothetical protein